MPLCLAADQLAAFIQQPVYVCGARCMTFHFADHVADRDQWPKFTVDGLDIAHARSICLDNH
jgi:hypothetical protein